jgi:hypothetical protein
MHELPSRVSEIAALEETSIAIDRECEEIEHQIEDAQRRAINARRKYKREDNKVSCEAEEEGCVAGGGDGTFTSITSELLLTERRLSVGDDSSSEDCYVVGLLSLLLQNDPELLPQVRPSSSWKTFQIPATPVLDEAPFPRSSSNASIASFFSTFKSALSTSSIARSTSVVSAFRDSRCSTQSELIMLTGLIEVPRVDHKLDSCEGWEVKILLLLPSPTIAVHFKRRYLVAANVLR